jgi:dolichol-phosphate mannosyltransferase
MMLQRFYLLQRKVEGYWYIDKIKFVGYAFQIEMKYRTFVKFNIVEVPIIFTDRTRRIENE